MKNISAYLLIFAASLLAFPSCKKYLNVNTNPNSPTTSAPELLLPQALVYTAAMVSTYNGYGATVVGMAANAGGYGGFGTAWTYNYTTTDGSGLWSGSYDVLNDFQYVINYTEGINDQANLNAIAKIMKVYNTQMLVDEYNNIPYSQALQGEKVLAPAYDDAKTVYQALANLLDSAISVMDNAIDPSSVAAGTDPLFSGDMTKWRQFANTLKLRLIIRASAVMTFSNTSFTADGFLTDDAVVNPGYALATGQVNPSWSSWVTSYTGSAADRAWMPAQYVFAFYDGTRLSDDARGAAIYYSYPSTPVNQLGVTIGVTSAPATAGSWYSGTGTGVSMGNAIGVMKGPDMGEPLMLAAESYFLQAEADVRGILSGTAKTDFESGINASFKYLYELPSGIQSTAVSDTTDAKAYLTTNAGNYLADFSAATSTDQQIEAIITQKYIALNFIHGHEAWNEYRRTGYPTSSSTVLNNGDYSFASTQSVSTRPDKLPTRLLYPNTEYLYNDKNIPAGISCFSSLIFWAK